MRAIINLAALAANVQLARRLASLHRHPSLPPVRLVAVIKANAYGHGLKAIAQFLADKVEMVAVARMDEALQIRQAGIALPVLVLGGAVLADEWQLAEHHQITLAVHQPYQLKWRQQQGSQADYWLKLETGMHRMGLDPSGEADIATLVSRLSLAGKEPVLMHHYACADTPQHPHNAMQARSFAAFCDRIQASTSCANSAVLCGQKNHQNRIPTGDLIRPGLMLYGASPLAHIGATDVGLQTVMQLQSTLISCKAVKEGEAVGYGATFIAPQDGYVGLVACGYGDGYPREFVAGARPQVRIGQRAYPLAGRVSMDSLAVWLGKDAVSAGSQVTLWGDSPTINEVADWSGTIPYTLFTGVTARVERIYETSAKLLRSTILR